MVEKEGNIMKGRGIIALGIIAMVIMTSGIASAEKGLTLTTDKSAYNLGEEVIITVTNDGDDVMVIPYGYQVVDEVGKLVFSPNILFFMPPLAPGETYSYTWKQICDDGTMVPAGDYTINTAWDSVEVKIFDSSSTGRGGKNPMKLPVSMPPTTIA